MKIRFCACGWRINIWNFILDSSAFAIWYFCSVSVIVLVFRLLFGFCNLVSASAIWYFCSVFAIILVFHLLFGFCNLVSASAIWYFRSVSAIVLVFLLFSFCNLVFELSFWKKKGVIFCLLLLQNLVFRLSFNFCNLIFLFYLCNCFGISSSLQFLQFGICVQFLQKNKK
jgi:hypothetical protein